VLTKRALAERAYAHLSADGAPVSAGQLAAAAGLSASYARLASRWVVTAGAQVEIHPAALPLDLVVISGRTVQWHCERRCCVMDGVVNGR
jgi:hypothetical protein